MYPDWDDQSLDILGPPSPPLDDKDMENFFKTEPSMKKRIEEEMNQQEQNPIMTWTELKKSKWIRKKRKTIKDDKKTK